MIAVVLLVFAAQSAPAQTFSVLYSFNGTPDGVSPYGGVIQDPAGNFYGTTYNGGTGSCACGTVFKLDKHGVETVLYSFTDKPDGNGPSAGLVRDNNGNLYGTTIGGGASGGGTIFRVSKAGKEKVLFSFVAGSDGYNPFSGLIRDSHGTLYGTNYLGGNTSCQPYGDCGTVFKVSKTGTMTVLYKFTGADGANPYLGSLLLDSKGNLYGTTQFGGTSGQGTVFKVDKNGKETVLYSFTGSPDGANPYGGLVRDSKGNFYGTTYGGGASGAGAVFKLDKAGKETVLYGFNGSPDGKHPYSGLVRDSRGNMYGTTNWGGNEDVGTIFKLDSKGNETVLHSFAYSSDGGYPFGNPLRDKAGNLYGTTSGGGGNGNVGTVWKLTP